jgi:hypothetical protein
MNSIGSSSSTGRWLMRTVNGVVYAIESSDRDVDLQLAERRSAEPLDDLRAVRQRTPLNVQPLTSRSCTYFAFLERSV